MAVLLVILLVVAAVTGTLWAVLKVAAGVALGIVLALVLLGAGLAWFLRSKLRRFQRDLYDRYPSLRPPHDV